MRFPPRKKMNAFRFLSVAALAATSVYAASSFKAQQNTEVMADSMPPQGLPGTRHERTFMAIKYDAIQRGNVAEIISRMEKKGYKLVGLKLVQPSRSQIEAHYADLKGRPFFAGTCCIQNFNLQTLS